MKYFILLFLLLIGCNSSEDTSEKVLKNFIKYRFEEECSKEKFDSFTSGEFLKAINELDDNNFKKLDLRNKFQFEKMDIIYRNCQENTKCYIAYNLSYYSLDEQNKKDSLHTVRKIATIINENEKWKIVDIESIKSDIEFLNEVDII